ncbi:uncharacterized protein TrAtP1_001049 [Trichoderma atroviride]|uniref:uncharacterized protein n=1 Tax=Hypocrea atroviridis TaxID=63577 RepID=UPI00332A002A|nr:hypothetical protein TrAtP1_001049 [Trichoderma atroviride]
MSSPRRRIETDVSHESATGSHLEDDPAVWGLTDCLLLLWGILGHEDVRNCPSGREHPSGATIGWLTWL